MSTNLPAGGWIVVPNSHVEGPVFTDLQGAKFAHFNLAQKVVRLRGEWQNKSDGIRAFAVYATIQELRQLVDPAFSATPDRYPIARKGPSDKADRHSWESSTAPVHTSREESASDAECPMRA